MVPGRFDLNGFGVNLECSESSYANGFQQIRFYLSNTTSVAPTGQKHVPERKGEYVVYTTHKAYHFRHSGQTALRKI